MADLDPFEECNGFQWDEGNLDKNWSTHGVTFWECEEFFFNTPLVVEEDPTHSKKEKRYYALGQTDSERLLFVVFTVRSKLIRVISARDMTRNEKRAYEKI